MNWDPWTGCYKISDGCTYCYYYGPFSKRYGQNRVYKTEEFDKPITKTTKGTYRIPGGKVVATCFSTDFFIAEADDWRAEAWAMLKKRPDLDFLILTKRIDRFNISLPNDWGDGYDNVNIGCTIENQESADYRLPLFLSYPIKRRFIAAAPLLEAIDIYILAGAREKGLSLADAFTKDSFTSIDLFAQKYNGFYLSKSDIERSLSYLIMLADALKNRGENDKAADIEKQVNETIKAIQAI